MHPKLADSALKRLEKLCLYNFKTDERYELDEEAYRLLSHCTGRSTLEDILRSTGVGRGEAMELLSYLQAEGCVVDAHDKDAPERFELEDPAKPSLRYLQLHITERCNLDCAHCYLGRKGGRELELRLIEKALEEFSPNGLKVLITGGEPLLHSRFWDVLELASRHPVRLELLSNGTLITEQVAERLSQHVHAVQVSIDGMEHGHELLRGRGSFERALAGARAVAGRLPLAIATMVHAGNLGEFEELERLVSELGASEWSLDVPSPAGNAGVELMPPLHKAAEIFRSYGFSSGVHEGDQSYSCGSHICSIDVSGGVSKCGFYKEAVGSIASESLSSLWQRVVELYTPTVDKLSCRSCRFVRECRGGCRYRAKAKGDFLGRDPFMCALHGVDDA